MNSSEYLAWAQKETATFLERILRKVSNLTNDQINFKSASNVWSVGEVLEHIATTNASYFAVFTEVLAHPVKTNPEQQIKESFFGHLFIRSVGPESKMRLPAPSLFQPVHSHLDESIVHRFSDNLEEFRTFLHQSEGVNVQKTKAYSPVSKLFRFTLAEIYKVIIVHMLRHEQQIDRILTHVQFPKK